MLGKIFLISAQNCSRFCGNSWKKVAVKGNRFDRAVRCSQCKTSSLPLLSTFPLRYLSLEGFHFEAQAFLSRPSISVLMRIFCVFSADILHYLVWWCHECATQSTNTNFLYLPLNLFYIMCMPTLWTLDLEPGHYIEVCTSQSSKHLQITNKKILTAQDTSTRPGDDVIMTTVRACPMSGGGGGAGRPLSPNSVHCQMDLFVVETPIWCCSQTGTQ